jgi:dolichol kinase
MARLTSRGLAWRSREADFPSCGANALELQPSRTARGDGPKDETNMLLTRTILGFAIILGGARLLLGACGMIAGRVAPESSRKLLHVGMGCLLLTCPIFFDRPWPVFTLAGVFVALLVARRHCRALDRHVAGAIYGVGRGSCGEFLFPIVAAGLFAAARGAAMFYLIPVALMTFADAAAAWVGTRRGRTRVWRLNGKSLEGSLAFFAVACLCLLPILHWPIGDASAAEGVPIAIVTALACTVFEAVSSRGWDNLSVPGAAFVLLHTLPSHRLALFAAGGAFAVTVVLVACWAPSFPGATDGFAALITKWRTWRLIWRRWRPLQRLFATRREAGCRPPEAAGAARCK